MEYNAWPLKNKYRHLLVKAGRGQYGTPRRNSDEVLKTW